MESYSEKFANFMRDKGLHTTRQRLTIADFIFGMPGHHTIEDLYIAIRQVDPCIGLATVYRTLKLLLEAGLVVELHFGDGVSRYEVATPGKNHNHLVCRQCGKIIEMDMPNLNQLQNQLVKEHEFILEPQPHCFSGLCGDCRAGQKIKKAIGQIHTPTCRDNELDYPPCLVG